MTIHWQLVVDLLLTEMRRHLRNAHQIQPNDERDSSERGSRSSSPRQLKTPFACGTRRARPATTASSGGNAASGASLCQCGARTPGRGRVGGRKAGQQGHWNIRQPTSRIQGGRHRRAAGKMPAKAMLPTKSSVPSASVVPVSARPASMSAVQESSVAATSAASVAARDWPAGGTHWKGRPRDGAAPRPTAPRSA